jgi:hypothetical protein
VGIVNRRNAVLGWIAWQIGKRVARRKAKAAVPSIDTQSRRPNASAIVSALAAVGGALWFWRRRKGAGTESSVS